MKVLVDLNVVLDVLLDRQPWVTESKQVWDAHVAEDISGWLVATELTNLFYIVRQFTDATKARTAVRTCLTTFDVLGVDQAILDDADSQSGTDFEDNVLIAAAVARGMDVIVTRNPQDFAHSPIEVLSPAELLERLATLDAPPASANP